MVRAQFYHFQEYLSDIYSGQHFSIVRMETCMIGKQGLFSEKKIGFDDSFEITKCLEQIEISDLLHVCT